MDETRKVRLLSDARQRQTRLNARARKNNLARAAETVAAVLQGDVASNVEKAFTMILAEDNEEDIKIGCLQYICDALVKQKSITIISTDNLKILRSLLVHPSKGVRTCALRVVRHFIAVGGPSHGWRLLDHHLDVFLIRTLEQFNPKVNKFDSERQQAIQVVRELVHQVPQHVPRSIVSLLLAMGQVEDDPLSSLSIETVCELALTNPRIVAWAGGFQRLVSLILESHQASQVSKSDVLVLTLLHVANTPEGRTYFRPDKEMAQILAPFTEEDYVHVDKDAPEGPAQERLSRMNASRHAIYTMLRSWPGMIYLCGASGGVQALVDVLLMPQADNSACSSLIGMLYQLFHFEVPAWSEDFLTAIGKNTHHTGFSPSASLSTSSLSSKNPSISYTFTPGGASQFSQGGAARKGKRELRPDLLDVYHAVLLVAFLRAGLKKGLIHIITSNPDRHVAVKATVLLGEMLHVGNKILPKQYASMMQALPSLVEIASSPDVSLEKRAKAQQALTNLDTFARMKLDKETAHQRLLELRSGSSARHLDEEADTFKLPSLDVSPSYSKETDEGHFQHLLRTTRLIDAKDFSDWAWWDILELVRPSCFTPARLQQSQLQKALRKLLSYYRPSSGVFHTIPTAGASEISIQTLVAKQLLEVLVMSEEGCRLLQSHELFPEINNALKDLHPDTSPLFNQRAIANTLTRDYFCLIGTLSSSAEGMQLLQDFRIFSRLYEILNRDDRPDLLELVISSVDFRLNGHARIIAGKILAQCPTRAGLMLLERLRLLYHDANKVHMEWLVDLLVDALYGVPDLARKSLDILEDLCEDLDVLDIVIRKEPALQHLGEQGLAFLTRFLCMDKGFNLLNTCGFVEIELANWIDRKSKEYVSVVEDKLVSVLMPSFAHINSTGNHVASGPQSMADKHVYVPIHFYGELCKTKQGTELLHASGEVAKAIACIDAYVANTDRISLVDVKAALWAVAHIGSCTHGKVLLPPSLIGTITNLALTARVLSMRGTCLYVLSLLGLCKEAAGVLAGVGWTCVRATSSTHADYACVSVALPVEVSRLFALPANETYMGSWALYGAPTVHAMDEGEFDFLDSVAKYSHRQTMATPFDNGTAAQHSTASSAGDYELPDRPGSHLSSHTPLMSSNDSLNESDTNDRILHHIGTSVTNLVNTVLSGKTKQQLEKLKQSNPDMFSSPDVFLEVRSVVDTYEFPMHVRNFINYLFSDVSIFHNIPWHTPQSLADDPILKRRRRSSSSLITKPSLSVAALPSHMEEHAHSLPEMRVIQPSVDGHIEFDVDSSSDESGANEPFVLSSESDPEQYELDWQEAKRLALAELAALQEAHAAMDALRTKGSSESIFTAPRGSRTSEMEDRDVRTPSPRTMLLLPSPSDDEDEAAQQGTISFV